MADDENKDVNGTENAAPAENPTPAPAPAPEPAPAPKPVAAPARAPARPKPGISALKKQQAEMMVQGEDGKMHKKVSTIVKVKAFLAISLPIAMVVLIGVGFIPMLEGGTTLWGKVWDMFFGAPQQGGRTAREYVNLVKQIDQYVVDVKSELPEHTEILKSTEIGKLVEKEEQVGKIYSMIGTTITNCEKAGKELKGLGVDRPKPEDFDELVKKLMPIMESYKELLNNIKGKIEANKAPEQPADPAKPEDKGVIIESGGGHHKKPEPPKEEPKPEPPKEEPTPEPPKEEPKPEPMPEPPKEEPKPEPMPEPPKEEPKPEPMPEPPKEEPKPEPAPEPPKEEPKPEPPKEEPKPEPPKEPAVDKFKQADDWVVKANASTRTIAGKMKNLPKEQEELKGLLDTVKKTKAVYHKAIDVYETDPDYTERVDKLLKLVKTLDEWSKTIQSKLE